MDEKEILVSRTAAPKEQPPPWAAYLYHREHGAKLFSDRKEYQEHLETGEWHDSPAKCHEEKAEEGDEFKELSKTAITRMKVDERAEWAMKWFGVQYAEDKSAPEIIDDLLKLQAEKVKAA